MDTEHEEATLVKVIMPVSAINQFVDQQFSTSRLLTEGEAVYEADHVRVCSIKEQHGDEVTLAALVLQTAGVSLSPHEVEVVIKGRGVKAASCSCKAGQHKCKHMVAVLLHIHAKQSFEVLSSTDLPQRWGKAQKEGVSQKYAPRKVIDLPCVKKPRKSSVVLPEGDILMRLLYQLPCASPALCHSQNRIQSSGASKMTSHTSERQNRSSEGHCSEPLLIVQQNTSNSTSAQSDRRSPKKSPTLVQSSEENCSVPLLTVQQTTSYSVATPANDYSSRKSPTLVQAVKAAVSAGAISMQDIYEYLTNTFTSMHRNEIFSLTLDQAKSPDWMEYRRGLITAPIAYAVYTRVHTLRTKMGPHDVRPLLRTVMRAHAVETAAMARGIVMETTARATYVSCTGHQNLVVQNSGLLVSEDHPCIGASPDGLVSCDCCPNRVLEIKCPLSLEKFQAKEMNSNNEKLYLKKTSKYYCQVQVQMALCKVSSADFFAFQDYANYVLLSVPFDDVFF